jgi:hypothetical protein
VTFDAPPAHTIAAIKKQVGKYKVDKIAIKLTGKAAEKSGTWYLGVVALKGEMTAQVAELKGKVITITGVLSEDEKGKQTCELSKVEEFKATK